MAYVPVIGPKPPHHRVTMSYSTITAAREVWVLISGVGKGKAYRETLAKGTTPLGRVLGSRTHSVVFNDIC
jgi:6-phosphogluconolactonase